MARATFLSSSSEGGGVRKNGFIIALCFLSLLGLPHPYHTPICSPITPLQVLRTSQNAVKRKSNF
jgi:hypothetical protein